jgi:hypothetical protein
MFFRSARECFRMVEERSHFSRIRCSRVVDAAHGVSDAVYRNRIGRESSLAGSGVSKSLHSIGLQDTCAWVHFAARLTEAVSCTMFRANDAEGST